jgi:ATP-dependent Zn protease
MRTWSKYVLIFVVAVAGTMAWNLYGQFQSSTRKVSLTQFLRDVDSGKVETISIRGDEVVGVNTQTGPFRTYTPRGYVGFVNRLIERDVDVSVVPEALWSTSCAPWMAALILIQAGLVTVLGRYVRLTARISSTA